MSKLKNFIKSEWFLLLLIIGSFIFGVCISPMLPEKVPMHWDINGQVNSYGPKLWEVIGVPLLNLGVYILMLVLPFIDPKKKNYSLFKGTYKLIRLIIVVYLIYIYGVTAYAALGHQIEVDKAIVISIGLLFLLLGNYMGRVRPNFFVGVRTPWTLSSDEVWKATHRFAGVVWVIGGALMIITIFINRVLTFSIVIILGLLPVLYSYYIYARNSKKL